MSDHTHKCRNCGLRFNCEGTLEHNYDGFPEVICNRFHKRGDDWCDACESETDTEAEVTGPDGVR